VNPYAVKYGLGRAWVSWLFRDLSGLRCPPPGAEKAVIAVGPPSGYCEACG
jgi:hypothetical protein